MEANKLTKTGKVFTKFPHIDQYRQIVQFLKGRDQYVGKDDDGNSIYDDTKPLSKYRFTGTAKIHGTNASICQRNGIRWVQSRNNIITVVNDNAGFASFVEDKTGAFDRIFEKIINEKLNGDPPPNLRICIFGEWFGKNIQQGVAVSNLPRKFAIFEIVCLEDDQPFESGFYFDKEYFKSISDHDNDIYNIYDFGEYELEVDLSFPELAAEKLTKLTYEVEQECPVGKYFGVNGIGEGIVWKCNIPISDFQNIVRFKTKGEKHSNSKVKSVKKLVTATPEEIQGIQEFLEFAVTDNRLEQGIKEICGEGITPDKIKPFIQWVTNDTFREELDTIKANRINPKILAPKVQEKARNYILKKIKGL